MTTKHHPRIQQHHKHQKHREQQQRGLLNPYFDLEETRAPSRSRWIENEIATKNIGELWMLVNSGTLDSIEQSAILEAIKMRYLANKAQYDAAQDRISGIEPMLVESDAASSQSVHPSDFIPQHAEHFFNEENDPSLAHDSAYPLISAQPISSTPLTDIRGDQFNQRSTQRFTDTIDLGTILRRRPCQIDTPYA